MLRRRLAQTKLVMLRQLLRLLVSSRVADHRLSTWRRIISLKVSVGREVGLAELLGLQFHHDTSLLLVELLLLLMVMLLVAHCCAIAVYLCACVERNSR